MQLSIYDRGVLYAYRVAWEETTIPASATWEETEESAMQVEHEHQKQLERLYQRRNWMAYQQKQDDPFARDYEGNPVPGSCTCHHCRDAS